MTHFPCGDRQATMATAPKKRTAVIVLLCDDFQCCLAESRDATPRCGGDVLVNLSRAIVLHLPWKAPAFLSSGRTRQATSSTACCPEASPTVRRKVLPRSRGYFSRFNCLTID
jgi:hypothetical protein